METLERNDKSIKAEGGHSSYSAAILWYAGCLSRRALQLSAVSNSKAGVHVCLRGRNRCFLFCMPDLSFFLSFFFFFEHTSTPFKPLPLFFSTLLVLLKFRSLGECHLEVVNRVELQLIT